MVTRLFFILFLVAALDLTAGRIVSASAQTPPPCPTPVTNNTTLKSDCVGTIVVAESGVTLNLGGHTVDCAFAFPVGIDIAGQSAVRVTNGTVTNCAVGILVNQGDNHIFDTNLNLVRVAFGIGLVDTDFSHLRALTISQVFCAGVVLQRSSNNKLNSVTITTDLLCPIGGPTRGVWVIVSSTNNVIMSSNVFGLDLGVVIEAESTANTIQSSTISNNRFGIVLFTSNNTIQSSTISDNQFDGIAILGAANVITATKADMNLNGIHVHEGSMGNIITSNSARNNAVWDLEDDNPNCDTNTWSHNGFDTANQPCIH